MKIIRYPNQFYMRTLGLGRVDVNVDYRFAKCILVEDVDDGKLLHNSLTRAIVFLKNEEFEQIHNINEYAFLYRNYFLVPEDFDEYAKIDQIKEVSMLPIDSLYLEVCNSYTILTTTACNARCAYCYEKGTALRKMKPETCKKVVEYIANKADITQPVKLSWFGGEPLVNTEAIDIIVNGLKNKGFQIHSVITTNGYLLNEELIDKAVASWGLDDAQVTLDGTQDVYNKIKNYVYKDDSNPFATVLDNIDTMLNNNIHVAIRLNVSLENKDNLVELIDLLGKRFGISRNLDIYCWPVFDEQNDRSEEENEKIFAGIKAIEDRIVFNRFRVGEELKEEVKYCNCMADSGFQILISPEGKLGTCEHYIDRNFWGDINKPEMKDYDILNTWRNYEPRIDLCKDCPIYGDCCRPTECMEMRKCDRFIKEWKISKCKKDLKYKYLDWKYEHIDNDNILYL